ncbi:TIR-like protein FxsC [Streptomyces sp. NBC_00091]|uniref:TIR-like protein FxsC n=1 Tax=Streptomyces sp. NBC_00091 TaxID=2975648 RepID=UPI0022513083|nr:TIR-like protein FxsC [Streptomyces sp. NBC_00091]MCX5379197.1 TIR-like protein FxsC [Streptomyces sp. NBC_00091]
MSLRSQLRDGGRVPASVQPYFFLSYAHTPRFGPGGPDPDMWVERLFRDLCSHIMALTDLPAGAEAGFMDREIRSGEGWSERLGAALATCRVFVPLFSPRYFASEMCGKEWFAFAQRTIQHGAISNQPAAEAIVPALWVPVPPSQLPGPAERLQFNHNTFGERYVTDGLYGLIKLRGYAEQYEQAVYELARRIVRVAETVRLHPVRPLDYRVVPSAFGPAGGHTGGAGGGPSRTLHVTVAASSRHDLPDGRSPEYYGESALDWNPYHPVSQRPIAYVAEDLVKNLNYQTTMSSFDDEAGHFDSKQPPTRPEILIVDRWAVEDEQRRQRLAAFDQEHRPWINVVVPWNRYDHQSRAKETELAHRLEETLPVKMSQGRAACRAAANGVANMETLGQILPQVVEAAAQQFLRHAQVYLPAGNTPTERPRLLGPMGMSGPPAPPPAPFPPTAAQHARDGRHDARLSGHDRHDRHDDTTDTDRGDADDSQS